MINKKCPKCNRKYTELENYCTKCGIELKKEENKCSENKTTMCSHRIYADDESYCILWLPYNICSGQNEK